jgi:nicotinate-nucleotide pyrophosphorylase (carboxylating)
LEHRCRELTRLAVLEDLGRTWDWTTVALVPTGTGGRAEVVARQPGVIAGLRAAQVALDQMECDLRWDQRVADGTAVRAGQPVAHMDGSARDLLTAERLVLNLVGRLSGIATLTRQYVQAVRHTRARIYDTRKTTPGWRDLEKYAVRCGGGRNHRRGLYEAVLIKDNHLALGATGQAARYTPAQAVQQARRCLQQTLPEQQAASVIVEVEVDTLEQLDDVLTVEPDIVLLDNMSPSQLREAVGRRDRLGADTELEASGNVNLETIASIAASGVERISVGALTHSAVALDVGLDWQSP